MKTLTPSLATLVPDGGVTAQLCLSTDWALTPIGPPEHWPVALRTMVSVIFRSRHPMFVFWGPELIQFYNDGYLPSFGRGKHPAAMGQRGRECWPEIWPVIGPQIERVMNHGESTWHEDQLIPVWRNSQMETCYWTYGYSPIPNDDGSVGGVLVVLTETTQRVEAERGLKASAQALRSFIMQAPVAMCILDGPQHVFRLLNSEFTRLLFGGRPAEDFVGKSLRVAVPEVEAQGYEQTLDAVFNTGKSFTASKMRATLVQANGLLKEMFVNFAFEALRNEKGRITGVLAVVFEVTDQVNEEKEIRSLAENLRAAITARDTFLGIASHELKTPLTSLKLQNQLNIRRLKKGGAGVFTEEKLQKLFESADLQADRLARLVEDMLDVYRLNAGKMSMAFERIDVSAAAEEVLERFVPQFEGTGSTLSKQIAADIELDVDPFRLEQVMINLLTNALKYAPGSSVSVSLQTDGDWVALRVQDDGPGIAPEQLERIFERFARVGPSDGIAGLGLGLYISREIVLAHGGDIRVESLPGAGTTFVVCLPRLR